uniref:Uncharacterized protein n=1 Tax=Avena sativa TaxID=4498 RepID=A0ACD5Z7E1_AVESA
MAAVPVPVPRQRDLLLTLLSLAAAVQLAVATAPPPRAYPASPSYRCGWCPRRSTASLLPPEAGALTGAACGYGPAAAAEIAAANEGFHIAAVSAGLFRRGQACGACYQLRCRGHAACGKDGVKVVVVSHVPETATNGTGRGRFLLSEDAFATMVHTPRNGGDRLAGPGPAVDVDFRRIPCVYRDRNLSVRVEEASARGRGHSLALRFLYQGGQTAIAAVEVAQAVVDGANDNDDAAPSQTTWRYMTRSEGSPAVWRTSRAPPGPLRLRVVVAAGSGGKWLRSDGAVLPADWVPGAVYDTGLRVADVAASTCGGASCDSDDEDGDEELR